MSGFIIVMPGSEQVDLPALQAVAADFGWEAQQGDLHTAAAPKALLLYRDAFGPEHCWLEVIRLCRFKLPEVRLIVCHGLAESIDWPALSRAGAFHLLSLPLKENEVRQSLGFVWEAEERLAGSAQNLLATAPERKSSPARRVKSDRSRGFYAPSVNYESA
jgi:hypothetical protein